MTQVCDNERSIKFLKGRIHFSASLICHFFFSWFPSKLFPPGVMFPHLHFYAVVRITNQYAELSCPYIWCGLVFGCLNHAKDRFVAAGCQATPKHCERNIETIMLTGEQKIEALKQLGIAPKMLPPQQLGGLFTVFRATGQLFEGSHMSLLFGHILALQNTNNLYELLLAGAPVNRIPMDELCKICKEVSIEEEDTH